MRDIISSRPVTWHLYQIAPIDCWAGWTQAAPQAIRPFARALLEIGWEGDIREGPFWAPLPPNDYGSECGVMYALKHDNNGDTFIISEHPLTYLNSERHTTAVVA